VSDDTEQDKHDGQNGGTDSRTDKEPEKITHPKLPVQPGN
jgi:hypothetical protein